jgi:hypothetical protein
MIELSNEETIFLLVSLYKWADQKSYEQDMTH